MIKKFFLLFSSWKIIIFIFTLAAPSFFPVPPNQWRYLGNTLFPHASYLEWAWANFDGIHYLTIAHEGYKEFIFAFFPFLPLTIYLFHKITPLSHLTLGLIINNASFFFSLLVVYRLALIDHFSTKKAWQIILLLVFFPFSFYYGAVYSESLYFLLATLSFYFARQSGWLKAGIFGYLAGLTRLVGLALLPALLVEWLQQNKQKLNWKEMAARFIKTKGYWVFLTALGIMTFSAYLQIRHGDFLLFQKSMANWNQDKLILPPQTVWRYLKIIFLFPQKNEFVYWQAVLEFVSTIAYFALSFFVLIKVRLSYGIFMLLSLIIPASTGKFESMPRYLLHLFPAFFALAILLGKNKFVFRLTLLIFLVLSFIFVALFTRGYFIG